MANTKEKSTLNPPPPAEWPYSVRLLSAILWLIVGLGLLLLARPVWYLSALAVIIAYLLQPLVERLARRWIPRSLVAAILIIILIVMVAFAPIILVPALFADIEPISIDLNAIWNDSISWVSQLPTTYPGITFLGFEVDFEPVYDEVFAYIESLGSASRLGVPTNLAQFLQEAIASATQVVSVATLVATTVIGRVASVTFSLLLILLLTYYLTTDLPRFRQSVVGLAPLTYQPEWMELWRRTGRIWNSFFRGQIVLSIVVGTTVWLGLSIIGVPGALVLGILAGILEVIPNLGPVLAAVPAVLLASLQGSTNYPELSNLTVALIVIALYVVVQQSENYILVPRILGGSVGVHPAVIIVTVTVFTIQFGILGAFIATPTIATLKEWFRFYHARILGRHPYPDLVYPRLEPLPVPETGEAVTDETLVPPQNQQVDSKSSVENRADIEIISEDAPSTA